ncbi:hypothetical protein AMTRI_Chr08g208160 [Amborella trichopoda]
MKRDGVNSNPYTFEPARKSSASTKVGGYPRRTCPRCDIASTNAGGYPRRTFPWCDIACTLCTSSSPSNPERMFYQCPNCTFFQWCCDYMEGMNDNINFKNLSQEHLMFKPEPVMQQQILDAYGVCNSFYFSCV